MSLDKIALPFHIRHAFFRVHGLLRIEPKALIMEFQTTENVVGLIKSRIKTRQIPLKHLSDTQLVKGPLGGQKLLLQTLYLESFKGLPTAKEGRCVLSIRRGDKPLAEQWHSQLELACIEARYATEDPLEIEAGFELPESLKLAWNKVKGFLNSP